MTLPARTRDEAHLYMDMHPCERCGGANVSWESVQTGGVRRYQGACGGCGAPREFVFALPEQPFTPPPGEVVHFGGPEPSRLLDPGEWLLVADVCAEAAGGAAPDAHARESMASATAAMGEVLKFVPADANAVPESAFWSARGRAVYHQEPGRFQRRRLLIVRDAYRETLDRMQAS